MDSIVNYYSNKSSKLSNNSYLHICDKHGKYCDKSCTNPNVDNGMMTKVWGPAGWLFLHCVSFGYPFAINSDNPEHLTKKEDYFKFFYYLGKVFPCKYCRESYQDFIKEIPLHDKLNTRKDLCKWLYDIHNKVNDKLGVIERPTFAEVEKKYEALRAKCTGNPANNANVEGFNNNLKTEMKLQSKPNGCVIPANGKPTRSIIYITDNFSDDMIIISKTHLAIYIIIIILITILICWLVNKLYKKNVKK
jgi:hypothetical protein